MLPVKRIASLFPFLKFRIEETSMSPHLKPGDIVIILKSKNIENNNVVVVNQTGDYFVKRIKEIKGDKVFLEGDNKKESIDSRKFGWVDKEDIIGKIVYKFYFFCLSCLGCGLPPGRGRRGGGQEGKRLGQFANWPRLQGRTLFMIL